ncbi:MAG TPA: hypothetical protein DD732_02505 [Rhizobiales bacterium]|nr:hypothetical protein [Hyphomicrobiales bacterium]
MLAIPRWLLRQAVEPGLPACSGRVLSLRGRGGRFGYAPNLGKLGDNGLAAVLGRSRDLRLWRASAPIREADDNETRNSDRSRAKRENSLERHQTRNQR